MPKPNANNSRDYRNALGRFATGITVVTTRIDDVIHGMTCNAFMSISLHPPLVAISVTHKAKMHELLQESGRFGISILGAEQEHISSHFAGYPQTTVIDPFIEVEGMPLIGEANAHFVTNLVEEVALGDHTLFVGQVVFFDYEDNSDPLIYNEGHYSRLARGASG